MNQSDTVDRFSTKADLYSRYRWDYAPEAIDAIFQMTQLSREASVADIGAGTGMVSRQLADRVKQVFAIEPNPVMRQIADRMLAPYSTVSMVDGLADATTLPDHSVDLITVGRAIHWFNLETTRPEFQRILKPGGWLAILQVPCMDQAYLDAFNTLKSIEYGWDLKGDKKHLTEVSFSTYYGHDEFMLLQFPDVRQEAWNEFLGRITSLSVAPDMDTPLYSQFQSAVRGIFDQFANGDRICLNVCTELALGMLR